MNASSLITLYDQIAETPDAVARLRRFVIDIATSGGFSTDRSSWITSPIEDCLEPLKDGKKVHQGWSPRCETFPARSVERWGVLKTTAIQDGFFLENENKELPARLPAKENLEISAGDILITCAGPRARCGIACWVASARPHLMISGKMYRFRADQTKILTEYLALFLRSSEAWNAIDEMKTGSSESGLNLTKARFRNLRVSFGALQEQREALAKVKELTALLDRLDATQKGREATRDRLNASSLASITASDSDAGEFSANARFVIAAIPALTTRPDQIKLFRQAILDLAVRGKLVKPDLTDEPASAVTKSMHDDRETAKKHIAKPDMTLVDFSLPSHWVWESLDGIISDGPQNGLSPRKSERADAPKAITLTATTSGKFDARYFKRVEVSLAKASRYWLEPDDLLFQRGNTREYVGMAAVYSGPREEFLFPDLMIRVKTSPHMDIRFVHLWCVAPFARHYLSSNASGAQQTMPKINQGTLRSLPIPVPPIAEQSRIVAKVNDLMALCDRLETALSSANTNRARLLETLLQGALSHDRAVDSEAAE